MTLPKISRKKNRNPPYFSHEFIIKNHGDIVSFAAMIIVVGLLYQGTRNMASNFVFVQYNVTDEESTRVLYSPGPCDLCMVVFYTLLCIVAHAVLQEYVLDKFNKKLNLTQARLSKFNESVHLTIFYALSIFWAGYNLITEDIVQNLSSLWDNYPHRLLPYWTKLYFIFQICYWLHDYPELYFQKIKKDLIPSRILHATIYLLSLTLGYLGGLTKLCIVLITLHYATDIFLHVARALHLSNYTKLSSIGFTVWNTLFIPTRMACTVVAFLALHYGLGKQSVQTIDFTTGNYNTRTLRIAAILFVFIGQAFMVWNFITFHERRRHDASSKNRFMSNRFNQDADAASSKQRKEKKKAKRDEEDTSDLADSDQSNQRDLRRRKTIK